MYELILLSASIFAGFLGALLGLGGGVIVVPFLTLVMQVDIRYAVAASLISVVATSSGAAASFLRDRLTNLRLAVILELGTVSGALVGFLLAGVVESSFLFLLFGIFLLLSAALMLRKREEYFAQTNHPWAEKLNLGGEAIASNGQQVTYAVEHVPLGLAIMGLAGIMSALLGIGSGIFKVLAMDGAMKLPLKVSTATSNFMIGVTAAASATGYLLRGDVQPEIAGPVAFGIIIGSWLGARAMIRLPVYVIRRTFVVVLSIVGFQMILKGLQ